MAEPSIGAPEPPKGFQTPPEVLRYFREKQLAPRFSWLDVWGEEHARAFTVAKAVETELLDAFRTSIGGALERGEGFETWKLKIEAELRRLGWFGPREVKDPELRDRSRKVDFSSPRRLRTIFWSNMNAARAAGQWDRIQRTKRALPFLLYVRTTAGDPRPEHLRWAGTILPVDDPFWRTHFPPNGWGCKCTVRQITRREGDALLAKGEQTFKVAEGVPDRVVTYTDKAPDDGPPIAHRNRRTGAVTQVPVGIDPGWHTNPGIARSRAVVEQVESAIARLVDPVDGAIGPDPARRAIATKAVREIVGSEAFAQHHAGGVAVRRAQKTRIAQSGRKLDAGERQAAETAAAEAHPFALANMPVAVLPERLDALRGERSALAVVSDRAIGHGSDRHPSEPADWLAVQQLLDRGEIQVDAGDDTQIWAFGEVDGDRKVAKLTFDQTLARWFVTTLFGRLSKTYRDSQRKREGRRKLLDEVVRKDAGGRS